MFDQWREEGREVAVVGLGASGASAARLLHRHGVAVYASDIGNADGLGHTAERLREEGVQVELGGHDLDRIARAVVVVVSPGVPPKAPAVERAREARVEVIAEVDLAALALRNSRWVGITGTNGKTTTTALTASLLAACGHRAEAVGNIGRPVSDVALEDSPSDWLVVELSSFQLHDAPHLDLAVGVLTNLSPDHLDRYPSLEAYYADKALLFRNAAPECRWVTNGDDAGVQRLAKGVPGVHLRWSLLHPADAWYNRSEQVLMLGDQPVAHRSEFGLLGDHNVSNALAAMLVAAYAGAAPAGLAEGLRRFAPLPHRLEPVREIRGVLWINDSKATNLASTSVAIEALDRPFVLLLGGRHKGEPYTRLAPLLGDCRGVVAYGESRPIIEADLGDTVTVLGATTFDEVLDQASRLASPGDAVLLSPAGSSVDMFENYEERGSRFRAAGEAL